MVASLTLNLAAPQPRRWPIVVEEFSAKKNLNLDASDPNVGKQKLEV